MEGLTRLVADSLARYGFDRPVDYRRLQWSRWFRCESPRSLLLVPSKPGVFALAEDIMNLGPRRKDDRDDEAHVGTAAPGCPAEQSSAAFASASGVGNRERSPAEAARRMLAVLRFCEADDMAFVLDRMFAPAHPMHGRLVSGHCFARFVVIDDAAQRLSICNALNQWMIASADRVSGGDFTSSLEFAPDAEAMAQTSVGRALPPTSSEPALSLPKEQALSASAGTTEQQGQADQLSPNMNPAVAAVQTSHLDSGSAANIHCPSPFPSGF